MTQKIFKRCSHRAQAGFSLLEMLIAVGILSAAAYVALDTVESNTGQTRYELTELRMQKIRRAIVGDPNLAVNGSPVVSGFVSDTGRLPRCLDALLKQDPDCDGDGTPDGNDVPPVYNQVVPGLSFGWRGPYLTAGAGGIVDGWGNGRGVVAKNFGWNVTPAIITASIDVESYGRDRADDGTGTPDSYDEDQHMAGISSADYSVSLSAAAISVEVTVPASGLDVTVCLAVLSPDPADPDDWLLIEDTTGPVTVSTGTTSTLGYSSSTEVPVGMRRLVVYDAASGHLTSGTCSPALITDKANLINSTAVLGSFGLLVVPRITPAVTIRLVL